MNIKKSFPRLVVRSSNPFTTPDSRFSYLDNAATTQKPEVVLQAMDNYYRNSNANPRRGTSSATDKASQMYEQARKTVAEFIGANSPNSIIFTKNCTEALNLVAQGFGRSHLKKGDRIVLTELEHHSNLIPWQIVAKQTGAELVFIPIDKNYGVNMIEAARLINTRTKIVSFAHISNVFGTILPVKELVNLAHKIGAVAIVDGAQAAGHIKVDVTDLDCDFYAFSGHKAYGPMGIGVLYGKPEVLSQTEPVMFGGGMISHVDYANSQWAEAPYKFEAGTPNVGGAVGLSAAINWIDKVEIDNIHQHENELIKYALKKLSEIPEVKVLVPTDLKNQSSIISITVPGIHPHDVGHFLDEAGVIVRTGHHCAEPLMKKLGIPGTVRLSVAAYNSKTDIDAFVRGMKVAVKILKN